MTTFKEELTLLNECLSGKKEAWDIFVERYSNLIYKTILRTLRTYSVFLEQPEVKDIFHGIFLSLMEDDCKKIRQYEGIGQCTFASWLQVITRNSTINFIKAQRQHVSLDYAMDETGPMIDTIKDEKASVHEQIESVEDILSVKTAIRELPSSDRFLLNLYYVKELPPEKIADILNVTVSTVYSKKNRVLEKIKKILMKKGIIARNPE